MYKKIKLLFIAAILSGLTSCSDDSTGPEETDVGSGEGEINVTGAQQAQHEGVAWYVGLRSDNDFINLTLSLSEYLPTESDDSPYGLSIRFIGNDGPFSLDTTTYTNGVASEDVLISVTYSKTLENGEKAIYSTGPNSTGSITILSISDTSIEVAFDVTIESDHVEAGQETEEGSVNIAGEISAECLTAEAGIGC